MLKAEIGGEEDHVEFKGNGLDALACVSFIINDIYKHIYSASPLLAFSFKSLMQKVISDDSSPVWELSRERGGGWNQIRIYPISRGLPWQGGMNRAA